MKRLSTFLLALLLMSIGANAESEDVSSSLLGNGKDNWQNASGTYSGGGAERYLEGQYTSSDGKVLYQSISGLANGIYEVTFYAVASSTSNRGFTTTAGTGIAQVFANSTVMDVTVINQTDCTPSDYEYTLTCEVTDNGTLEYGLQNVGTGGNWYVCQGISLVYSGAALNSDDTYYASVADICQWTTTGNNGTHERNTWSTETDNSGMVVPFCQNWVWEGDNKDVVLTTATISHETLTGLTPGHYTVSMDIRIFSEAGKTIGKGTTFNANNASEDLDYLTTAGGDGTEGSYNDATEVYGTYKLDCIVYDDGLLDISIQLPETPTYNWIAWKNLSVKYTGPIDEPAIGYATADKTVVQPGESVTITFKKVAPDEVTYTLSGSEFTDATSNITVSYTPDGVFTFTVPNDAAYNSTFTVTIPAGQLYYTDTEVSNAAQTITFTVPYMLNESLTSGMFLKNLYNNDLMSRGKNYGTRADVDFIGIPLEFVMNDNGKYIIRYADADLSLASSNYLYGDSWAWADGNSSNATTFTVEEVSDEDTGELLGYHFISDYGYLYRYDAAKANAEDTDDNYALAVNGIQYPTDGYNYTDDPQAIWTFVDKEERDAIKAQWVSDQKVAVAEAAGITVTSGDDFDKYVASLTETEIVENEISTETTFNWSGGTLDSNGYGVESYQNATRLTRSFTGLDQGIYKITLNGLDRNSDNAYSWQMYQDGYTDLSESYIYANGYEINLQAWGSEATRTSDYVPNNMTEASNMFNAGSYLNTLYTYVDADGNLDIQIALLVTEYFGWAQVKNFSLYKLEQEETTISWDMTDAGYGTLILPFDYNLSNDENTNGKLTAYTIGSVTTDNDDDDIAATLSLTEASEPIKANTPYIMGGTEGKYTFKGTPTNTQNSYTTTGSGVSLTGTLVDMDYSDFTPDAGQYVLQNHEEGGLAFYPIVSELSSEVTLDAYHCYLTYSGTSPVRGFISFPNTDGEATAIKAIEGAEAEGNGAIYDLSGRKVSKAVKGVYIQNGKKVLVK